MHQPAGTETRDLGARLTANSGLLEPAGLYSVAVLDEMHTALRGLGSLTEFWIISAGFFLFVSV